MIRKMVNEDSVRAAEISVYGWRNTYRGIVSDEILFKKILVSNKIKHFENAIENGIEESYVYDDGIIKAILTIGKCRDADKQNSYELWGIYVDPFMQHQGIGKTLLKFCEEQGRNLGYGEVVLWTFEKNQLAREFYEKCGYQADGKENSVNSRE